MLTDPLPGSVSVTSHPVVPPIPRNLSGQSRLRQDNYRKFEVNLSSSKIREEEKERGKKEHYVF